MRYFLTFFIVLILLFITAFVPSLNLFASETIRTSYLITDTKTFSSPSTLYHSSSVTFPWQSGKVVIAGNPEGTANADVGIDMAILSSGSTIFTFKGACSSSVATEIPMPPLDITHMVTAPSRTLKFDFRKPTSSCVPSSITIGPVYLVHFSDAHYKASTFLGLPFDYTKKVDGTSSGLSFEQAALGMDTFFDHNAPLRTLNEEGSGAPITSYENYLGQTVTSPYSGFEGYGWGEKAGVSAGTTVIAAASGKAYYENSEFCGEMVYINHSVLSVDNSTTLNFQTRYCQINPLPDIKNLPPQGFKIVSQSDPIGTVSLQPTLTAKPQLYFVVIFDKDNDLQFNDNLSDGVIDPFKTYLFQTTIPNLKRNYLAATNNNFSVGTTTFNFLGNLYRDSNFVFRDTFLTFKSAPRNTVFIESSTQKKLHSASTVIVIEKNDEFGNSIETFAPGSNKYFTMNMAYSPSIASNFIPNSLALYYSKDGLNWIKESSSAYTISSNSVSANINHLTQFAILGEVADSQPPSTTILVNNQAPLTNYSEPVTFTLQNNEGSQSNTIFYKINTGSFLKYQSPVTLSASQTYVIYFFSEDSNNNVEALNSKTFTIQNPTPTPTLTPTPTNTPTPTSINTETLTSTPTPTLSPTPTNTSIITLTPTLSITPTPTISITLASVLTTTNTPYPTNTIANTQTPTSTLTPLPTITPTKSPIGKLKHKANIGNDLNTKTVPENEKNNNDVLTVTKSVNIKGESSSDRSIFSITIPILTILSLLLLTYYLLIFKKKQK